MKTYEGVRESSTHS